MELKFGNCIDCCHLTEDHMKCGIGHWSCSRSVDEETLSDTGCCNHKRRDTENKTTLQFERTIVQVESGLENKPCAEREKLEIIRRYRITKKKHKAFHDMLVKYEAKKVALPPMLTHEVLANVANVLLNNLFLIEVQAETMGIDLSKEEGKSEDEDD